MQIVPMRARGDVSVSIAQRVETPSEQKNREKRVRGFLKHGRRKAEGPAGS